MCVPSRQADQMLATTSIISQLKPGKTTVISSSPRTVNSTTYGGHMDAVGIAPEDQKHTHTVPQYGCLVDIHAVSSVQPIILQISGLPSVLHRRKADRRIPPHPDVLLVLVSHNVKLAPTLFTASQGIGTGEPRRPPQVYRGCLSNINQVIGLGSSPQRFTNTDD